MQIVRSCGSRACLEVALSDNLLLAEKKVARIMVWGWAGEQRGRCW